IAGTDGQNLYLLIVVTDPQVTLEQTIDPRLPPEKRGDHLWLSLQSTSGEEQTYLFATSAPGLISARRPTVSRYGEPGEQTESRIQGWWQPDHNGYRLEISVPLAMLATHFGFEVVDVGRFTTPPLHAGTLSATGRRPLGRLLLPSTVLQQRLKPLLPPDTY